jgi:hypothetical protein
VGLFPSSSLAVAEQVRAVEVVTPLLGLTVTESTLGSVFSTLTLALSESLPPSASAAVAVQVMVSPGELVVLVKVSVESVPRELLSVAFVHA